MNNQKSKTYVFGGSFSPPHNGHVEIVRFLSEEIDSKEIWIIPPKEHPFKKDLIPLQHRISMCSLAFSEYPKIRIMPMDYKYYYDLVNKLHEDHPEKEFVHVIGEDCAINIVKWQHGSDLVQKEKFIVFERREGEKPWYKDPGSDNEYVNSYSWTRKTVDIMTEHISSSVIRDRIKVTGMDYFTPRPVLKYILDHGLYK